MNKLKELGRSTIALLVAGLVAAALVVWQGGAWWKQRGEDDRRAEAVAVAEAQVLDLTTMDTSTVESQMKKLSGRLSGDFKSQFEGFAENFVNAVTDEEIQADGEIKGSAISEFDDDSATVLVASSAQVGHGGKKAVERGWRFSVELVRADDEWLISGMEFVQ